MTEERRKQIMSQEALSINDISELYGVSYSQAATLIRRWKRQAGDRLSIQGRIHILDYKIAIRRDVDSEEIVRKENEEDDRKVRGVRSVCFPQSSLYG